MRRACRLLREGVTQDDSLNGLWGRNTEVEGLLVAGTNHAL